MFNLAPNLTDLNIEEKNVLRVFFSMNIHQAATPEGIPEDARSYIIFFREGGGRISAYIELLLLNTNRKLFYVHSSNVFSEEDVNLIEDEARGFAEGLGAVLDEVNMTKMTQQEKNRWIEEHHLLTRKPPSEQKTQQPQPEAPQTPQSQATASPAQEAGQTPPAQQAAPAQPVQPQQLAAMRQQEIMQQAVKAGIAKPLKQALHKESQSATGVVSRDREALVRLLTSF